MRFYRFSSIVLLTVIICFGSLGGRAQSIDRAQLDKEIDELWQQIKVKQDLLLELTPADREAHAEFLKQPDTGLIRLLPREKYDYAHKLPIHGGGAYYSFVLKTHEYGRGSDVEFSQGNFSVGFAGMDYGYFLPLDDVPLDAITLEHPVVKALVEYQPRPTEAEIRAEYRNSSQGFKLGEFTAKRQVPAKVDTSYVLRSISFDHSDVLVAIRAVRKEPDGSVILLWRILKNFPKPTAIRSDQN
jgi:hypothetical protein